MAAPFGADVPANDNLFVWGLPGSISDDQVRQIFGSYGNVTQCRIVGRGTKCSALVRMQSVEQAQWMVENVNGNVPNGLAEPVNVKFADTPEVKAQRAASVVPPPQLDDSMPSNRIFVTGLPPLDEASVKAIFEAYGTVQLVKLVGDRTSALVTFGTQEEASRVVQGLNGVVPNGLDRPVTVQFSDSPETVQRSSMMAVVVNGFAQSGVLPGGRWASSENAVYIAGLPPDTEDVHLYRLFSCFGPIAPKGVRAMLNPDGTCKGIGFVNYLTPEAVQAAISTFNGALLPDGTVLKVAAKQVKSIAGMTVPPPMAMPMPMPMMPS